MDWLRIHVSNLCNFKCPNCHVFELGENNLPSRVMNQEIFNQSIDQFLNVMTLKGHKKTMVSIYGGETLANKKVIKDGILRYGNNCNGIQLNWVVNTNGSLLKEEDIIFFKEHNVEIHISVDGPEDIHNLSRPTHKGKGTFHMVVPALELIKKYQSPAQINSYMMPSNYLHLKEIVDIAEKYGIKKIYLDQFYNLDMISHQVGMEKYREVFYYALHKDIQINGPWGRVIKKHQRFMKKRDHLEKSLAVDVNIDGTFYFPIVSETKKDTRDIKDLTSFFEQGGWNKITERARKNYDEKCDGCSIKDHCYGSAIEQVHYHIGTEADTEVSCNFFRDWCSFLLRPVYFKRFEKIDVLSMINLEQVEPMAQKISEEIARLEKILWPLQSKIIVNISEYPEEFKAACQQYNLPSSVKAITVGDRTFFHLGTELTPSLVRELVHLFIAQKNLQLPIWFIDGVSEWIQDAKVDRGLLKEALKENNLLKLIEIFSLENKNVGFLEAKAFVGYLESSWGREGLLTFLERTKDCHFEEAFLIQGEKSFIQYLTTFWDISA